MIRAIAAVVFAALVWLLARRRSLAQTADRVMVFAAASLTDALEDIGAQYGRERGKRVVFSFAASMTLARQIDLSAGADAFVSADAESMDYLEQRNRIARQTRQDLLGNRLVLISPAGSNLTLAIAPQMKIAEALGGGRLAMANVETVPAGRYGKAALTALGVWDAGRQSARPGRGRPYRARLCRARRGALGHRLRDGCPRRTSRPCGRNVSGKHPSADRLSGGVDVGGAARRGAVPGLSTRPEARAVFERAGFTVLAPRPVTANTSGGRPR